jgi:hypothetical protein
MPPASLISAHLTIVADQSERGNPMTDIINVTPTRSIESIPLSYRQIGNLAVCRKIRLRHHRLSGAGGLQHRQLRTPRLRRGSGESPNQGGCASAHRRSDLGRETREQDESEKEEAAKKAPRLGNSRSERSSARSRTRNCMTRRDSEPLHLDTLKPRDDPIAHAGCRNAIQYSALRAQLGEPGRQESRSTPPRRAPVRACGTPPRCGRVRACGTATAEAGYAATAVVTRAAASCRAFHAQGIISPMR